MADSLPGMGARGNAARFVPRGRQETGQFRSVAVSRHLWSVFVVVVAGHGVGRGPRTDRVLADLVIGAPADRFGVVLRDRRGCFVHGGHSVRYGSGGGYLLPDLHWS